MKEHPCECFVKPFCARYCSERRKEPCSKVDLFERDRVHVGLDHCDQCATNEMDASPGMKTVASFQKIVSSEGPPCSG